MFFVIDSQTGNQASPLWYPTVEAARNACDYFQKITGRPCHVRVRPDGLVHEVVLDPMILPRWAK